MKRPLFYLLLSFFAVLSMNAQTLQDSLVAYYPFSGNANDSSDNNNHGTVNGAQLTRDAFGNSGSAYYFDGQDDYIVLDTPVLLPDDLTISAWVRFDDLSENMAIFTTRSQCATSYRGWTTSGFSFNSSYGLHYTVYQTGSCSGGSGGDTYYASGFTPDTGTYYFVSLQVKNNSQEGRTVDFYVNNIKYQTVQYGNSWTDDAFTASDYRTLLGGSTNVRPERLHPFEGVIDEIRVYNRTLDALQLDTLFKEKTVTDSIIIVNHPSDKTVLFGSSTSLQVLSFGESLNYQWFKNYQEITGSDSCNFMINSMTKQDTGKYFCKIFNTSDTVYTDTVHVSYCLEQGLLAYYPFDGNANDESGNNFHGTVNGAVLTNDVKGNPNSAYYFDGDDYIDCGSHTLLNQDLDSFTLSAWIYPEHINENARILNNRGQGTFGGQYPGYQWKIMNENENTWSFRESAIEGVDGSHWDCSNYPVNHAYGQWYHVAMVYDNLNFYFYVDGVLTDTMNASGIGDISNDLPTVIGAAIANEGTVTGSASEGYKGIIDEIKIYDKILSAESIRQDFEEHRYKNINEDLLVWYPFNSDAKDASGNGFHGTVNGAQLIADPQIPGNSVYYFDGVDDYINIGDSSGLKLSNNFTLEAWVNLENLEDYGMVINKEGEYELYFSNTEYIYYAFNNSSPGWASTSSNIPVDLKTWTHIVLTFENGDIKVYKNGVLHHTYNGSGTISGDKFPDFNDLRIGGRQKGNNFFKGLIDEVKIYKRILDSSEIINAYNDGRSTKGQVIDVYDTITINNYVTVTDTLLIDVTFNSINGVEFNTIKVYPNPTNDIVYISLEDVQSIQDHSIKIMDVSGKVVHESMLNTNLMQIDMDSFGSEGLYFIRVMNESGNVIETRQIILQ